MKLPEIRNGERYVGLYVVDFGDHSGVGFTADEDSEIEEYLTRVDESDMSAEALDGRLIRPALVVVAQ